MQVLLIGSQLLPGLSLGRVEAYIKTWLHFDIPNSNLEGFLLKILYLYLSPLNVSTNRIWLMKVLWSWAVSHRMQSELAQSKARAVPNLMFNQIFLFQFVFSFMLACFPSFLYFLAVVCDLRLLVPWSGIEPMPWQWKHCVLTTRRLRSSQLSFFFALICWNIYMAQNTKPWLTVYSKFPPTIIPLDGPHPLSLLEAIWFLVSGLSKYLYLYFSFFILQKVAYQIHVFSMIFFSVKFPSSWVLLHVEATWVVFKATLSCVGCTFCRLFNHHPTDGGLGLSRVLLFQTMRQWAALCFWDFLCLKVSFGADCWQWVYRIEPSLC